MWFVTGEGLGRFWKSFGGDSLAKGDAAGNKAWADNVGRATFELAAHKVLSAQALLPTAVL